MTAIDPEDRMNPDETITTPPVLEDATLEASGPAPVGPATKFGTAAAALALTIPGIGELADAAEPLGVPPDLWVKLGAGITCLVIVGRYAQAAIDHWHGIRS